MTTLKDCDSKKSVVYKCKGTPPPSAFLKNPTNVIIEYGILWKLIYKKACEMCGYFITIFHFTLEN